MRFFDKPICEGLTNRRKRVANRARQQSGYCFDHGRRCHLSPHQDEVAERDLLLNQMFRHPIVDPLVATTDQRHRLHRGPPDEVLLLERLAGWSQQYPVSGADLAKGGCNWFDPHDHARPSPKGLVIDLAVFAKPELPKIGSRNVDDAVGDRFAEQAGLKGRFKEFWEDGDDIDLHAPQGIFPALALDQGVRVGPHSQAMSAGARTGHMDTEDSPDYSGREYAGSDRSGIGFSDTGEPRPSGIRAGLQEGLIEQALQVARRSRHIESDATEQQLVEPGIEADIEPELDESEFFDPDFDDPHRPTEDLSYADSSGVGFDGFELTIEDFGSTWSSTVRGWVIDDLGNTVWRPIVTTTDMVPNWEIDSTLGMVTGEATLGLDTHAVGRMLGEPGGRRNLEQRVHLDRTAAQQAMIEDAVARGAHAVVGVSAGYTPIGDILVITCSGTAVTLRVPTLGQPDH